MTRFFPSPGWPRVPRARTALIVAGPAAPAAVVVAGTAVLFAEEVDELAKIGTG